MVKDIKINEKKRPVRFVQTELNAHEAWARLIMEDRRAAQLMHILVANVGDENAVIISQKTLAQMMGVKARKTVVSAVKTLKDSQWIDVVKLEQRGGVNAYIINSNVAWSDKRDNLQYAHFRANVIVASDVQDEDVNDKTPLRKLPQIGEIQIPNGEGLEPPSSPSLPNMEPDLPAAGTQTDIEDFTT